LREERKTGENREERERERERGRGIGDPSKIHVRGKKRHKTQRTRN